MTIVFIAILLFLTSVESQQLKFLEFNSFVGDTCAAVESGVEVNGVCTPILDCQSVLANVRKSQDYHKVCGYVGKTQIVCCPTSRNMTKIGIVAKLNLAENVNCRIARSNEIGIMKFWTECPELNQERTLSTEMNRFCDNEVCSDLVCCPVRLTNRLKNVCWNVDHPIHTLKLRLLQNKECTITALNITGKYQKTCDYAERNPQLKPILRKVCNDVACDNWYCCPLEELDKFHCLANLIPFQLGTLIGPRCVDSRSGRRGTCKPSHDCYEPQSDLNPMDKCGSYCCSDYYCCPDEFDTSAFQSATDRECYLYTKSLTKEEIEVPMSFYINNKTCGSTPYAAGGILVSPGDFPHMAALGYESGDQIVWNCGGSLISNRFVLTAGHCLSSRESGPVRKVRLGVIDLSNDIKTKDCPEEFDVAQIIPHPEYDIRFVYNDIGLIALHDQVKFNFHIRPICLPTNSDVPQRYESMGWGSLGPGEGKSVKLIKVDQELFSHEECQKLYQFNSYLNPRIHLGIVNETHICAGSRKSIQSTCEGDSGGPLHARHPKYVRLFSIYGVVSFGTACGFVNNPGIYTKVFPYVKWIEGIIWPQNKNNFS